jgi:hypothetical protein
MASTRHARGQHLFPKTSTFRKLTLTMPGVVTYDNWVRHCYGKGGVVADYGTTVRRCTRSTQTNNVVTGVTVLKSVFVCQHLVCASGQEPLRDYTSSRQKVVIVAFKRPTWAWEVRLLMCTGL